MFAWEESTSLDCALLILGSNSKEIADKFWSIKSCPRFLFPNGFNNPINKAPFLTSLISPH